MWNVVKNQSLGVKMEVNSVLENALQDFMQGNGEKNIPPITIVSRKRINKKQDVYNLNVENQHEYFANGILVSNCFATLYYRLAVETSGSGLFYNDIPEKTPVIDSENNYDVMRAFRENNQYGDE